MNWSKILYVIPYLISFALSVGVGIYAWRRRHVVAARTFAAYTFAEASMTLFYIVELFSVGVQAKIFWDDLQFIGMLFAPAGFLAFTVAYTGRKIPHAKAFWSTLIGIASVFLLLIFTDNLHHWIRSETRLIPYEPFAELRYSFTLMFWVMSVFAYALMFVGIGILIFEFIRPSRVYRAQAATVLIGAVIPLFGSALTLLGVHLTTHRDTTPFTFAIANLVIAWGVFRYRLFDLVPIARAAVLEQMQDAVIVLDMQSRIVDLNPAARVVLNKQATAPDSKLIGAVFSSWPILGQKISIGSHQHPELGLEFDEQFRYFEVELAHLRNRNGDPAGRLVVLHDITERKAVEVALQQARDDLERRVQTRTAELEAKNVELETKNAELERFTYTVSHDLKSPLITIGGFVGFLEKDALAGNMEQVKVDIARINDATARMQRLLNELLELSRIGRMMNPPEEVSFEVIAHEAVTLTQGRIAAHGVEVEVASGLPTVYGDRARLVEVLQNLVDNACKFMGDQPYPRIEIGVRQDGDERVFFVRDNGIGIEPQYYAKVFELFEKLDPQSEGTGVGLALVKRIVETHGGKIWVESAGAGHGSTLCFTLPPAN